MFTPSVPIYEIFDNKITCERLTLKMKIKVNKGEYRSSAILLAMTDCVLMIYFFQNFISPATNVYANLDTLIHRHTHATHRHRHTHTHTHTYTHKHTHTHTRTRTLSGGTWTMTKGEICNALHCRFA